MDPRKDIGFSLRRAIEESRKLAADKQAQGESEGLRALNDLERKLESELKLSRQAAKKARYEATTLRKAAVEAEKTVINLRAQDTAALTVTKPQPATPAQIKVSQIPGIWRAINNAPVGTPVHEIITAMRNKLDRKP